MTSYRIYHLLERLLQKHGPSEFGRICQILLGLTLKEMGFKICLFQLAGRPDIVVLRENEGYALEVKAQTGNEVIIKEEDLKGVVDSGYQPILAILSYPEIETKWLTLDARSLRAGKFNKISLERHSIKTLEENINQKFLDVVEEYYENALAGGSNLRNILGGKS